MNADSQSQAFPGEDRLVLFGPVCPALVVRVGVARGKIPLGKGDFQCMKTAQCQAPCMCNRAWLCSPDISHVVSVSGAFMCFWWAVWRRRMRARGGRCRAVVGVGVFEYVARGSTFWAAEASSAGDAPSSSTAADAWFSRSGEVWHCLLARRPHKNCKNDLDGQT